MSIATGIRQVLRRFGLDLVRYDIHTSAMARRARLLQTSAIDVVLDVGASSGEYGRQLRVSGFSGRIVSFEPLVAAFSRLQQSARRYPPWEAHAIALGDSDGEGIIHVAENSVSSSLLPVMPRHERAAADSTVIADQPVRIRALDGIFDSMCRADARVFMKLDVQGFEQKVLDGAKRSLPRISLLEIELSLVPLYEGAPVFDELYAWLAARDYFCVSLESVFADPQTGQCLQVNGIFQRRPAP